MSTTLTAVGGGYGGHCCVCARACMHTTPPSYCPQHGGARRPISITTTHGSPSPDCGAQCACYWRGRRDEAKA